MKKILSFAAVSFVVTAFACGGSIDPGGNDGSTNQDASDASLSPHCPSTLPADGATCAPSGTTCEYGSDPNLHCNTIASCNAEGSWMLQTPPPSGCPTPTNASDCPSSFGAVQVGEHCGALVGLTCTYAQGNCGCSVGGGGPYPEDAAAVATWTCDAPETGCPIPRPKLGTTCAQEGLQCDYSPCTLPTGTSILCHDGAWQENEFGCAL